MVSHAGSRSMSLIATNFTTTLRNPNQEPASPDIRHPAIAETNSSEANTTRPSTQRSRSRHNCTSHTRQPDATHDRNPHTEPSIPPPILANLSFSRSYLSQSTKHRQTVNSNHPFSNTQIRDVSDTPYRISDPHSRFLRKISPQRPRSANSTIPATLTHGSASLHV